MKHSTEYLFDKPRSEYEPELTMLATKRVKDGRTLLKKLSKDKNTAPSLEIPFLQARYLATEEAIAHWQKILEE